MMPRDACEQMSPFPAEKQIEAVLIASEFPELS